MLNPNFQIKKVKQTDVFGEFIIEPLEQGYGHTLGNALRRVLLTSLPGAAITKVKISGVKHKFSTLSGLSEDIIELCLSLKQIRVKYAGEKPVKLELDVTGPAEIKAGDIKMPATVEVFNKGLVLAHLADKKSRLKMELVVENGFGYWPVEERKSEKLGEIILDASFSPIIRVNYKVEATRVGHRTDLDRLILGIYSDGTVKPAQALKESAKILGSYFDQIVNPKAQTVKEEKPKILPDESLKLTVEELELPTRIANALRMAGYETVTELAAALPEDLAKVKNLGEKSLKIIYTALAKKGVVIVKKGEK